jgi:glycosyltransferase involved in cell wall biosynthesis
MISIIIPALNEEKHIGTLLQSLSEQDFDEDVEVVVADAGSQDKTREIVMSYKDHFYKVSVVEGGMPAVGRNNGAKASSGEIIFFLDADLKLPGNHFLRENVSYFRNNNLSVATTPLKPDSEKFIDHLLTNSYNLILRPAKYIRPLGAMCIVARRDAFEKSGGYPEDVVMAEDHDFVKNCLPFGKYDILPVHAIFSVRRFDKEGRLGLAIKYLQATIYRIFKGPIRKPIFEYEFKYSDDEDARKSK